MKNLYGVKSFKAKKIELQNELQQKLTKLNDQVILSNDDWNVDPIPSWIIKVSPSTIKRLRKLAEKDRELRGFSDL